MRWRGREALGCSHAGVLWGGRGAQVCDALTIPTMVLIRPRGGDFVFDSDEVHRTAAHACVRVCARVHAHVGAVGRALVRGARRVWVATSSNRPLLHAWRRWQAQATPAAAAAGAAAASTPVAWPAAHRRAPPRTAAHRRAPRQPNTRHRVV